MVFFFFFNDTATTEIYTLSLHDALPISAGVHADRGRVRADLVRRDPRHLHGERAGVGPAVDGQPGARVGHRRVRDRSEEHTSELQSRQYLVCRLLLEKKTRTDGLTADLA